jgi:hypothetical protein
MGLEMRVNLRAVWVGAGLVALLVWPGGGQRVWAQHAAGCTPHKSVYSCNWAAFQEVLASAHTVWVPVDPMDRFTSVQLRRLVESLGKTVSANEEDADLEMDVVPAVTHGVTMGPADQALATLRVFARGEHGETLVWAETFRGQGDRPWASSVHSAIAQFRERMAKP